MSDPTQPRFPLRLVRRQEAELDRRVFLKTLGAGLIAAGASACTRPAGDILPYVVQPPELVPGVPRHYATAMELDGYATGLIVESREGRPVKVEGNPAHPASLGATGAFEQAAVYQLYDPDRPSQVRLRGITRSWLDCAGAFSDRELRQRSGAAGAGLHLLLEPTASPTVAALLDRIRTRFPELHVHYYAPFATGYAEAGVAMATGARALAMPALDRADIVATFDANLLAEGPFHLAHARRFADRRRIRSIGDGMNRLYVAEGAFTPTGIIADHRRSLRPSEIAPTLASVLDRLLAAGLGTVPQSVSTALRRSASRDADAWRDSLVRDLLRHRGRAVVAAGPRQPAVSHAIAAAINAITGGDAVSYVPPVLLDGGDLSTLIAAMEAGEVGALVVIGGNPSYNTTAEARFSALARSVPLSLFAGPYENETAQDLAWFVPLAHFLESWGDARALDGTASVVQPLIAPLHGARSPVELLAWLSGENRPANEIVRQLWTDGPFGGDAESWVAALTQGLVRGSESTPREPELDWNAVADAIANMPQPVGNAIELSFTSDPSVYDGRFANNPWLQELPDPVAKLTWDNAAFMNERTRSAIGAEHGQVVELVVGDRRLRAPVFSLPGVADSLIVLPLGYGRRGAEETAAGVGVDAYTLLPPFRWSVAATASPALAFGAVPLSHEFAVTAAHWSLEGRPVVLSASLERFRAAPHFTAAHKGPLPSWYPPTPGAAAQQWAMAIDLTVCTGCSACMVACQAENNVPVVGKDGVLQRREMHWLRIDRYLQDAADGPRIDVQPMLCQQCEHAPCEYVCPVNATVHSPDGLNEMIYNRCVGTRFCSNNCPYKVRRFNFLNYTQLLGDTEQMAMNPDVTVRARGVMEKCTFCVQRIRRAGINDALDGSGTAYAGLQTACQQACPTRAIAFGSITDANSEVAALAGTDQSYHVLHELGTRPRIWYLARLRNTGNTTGGPE
ncbi:MAG: 4Fe-4S dicluster domain-containing protein [Vicinamibacterales bacterium]